MKKKLKLIGLGFGIICISALAGFLFTKNEVKNDSDELVKKIDRLFKNSETLIDGVLIQVTGSMSRYNKREFLLDYGGGFQILKLTKKDDNSYIKSTINAGNLVYKEDEYENTGYGYFSNYRQSIDQCYASVFNQLLKGNDNQNKPTPNKYNELLNFPSEFKTKYHYLYRKLDDQNVISNHSENGNAYTNFWSISYHTYNEYYVVGSHDDDIENLTIKNMLIFLGCGILIYLLVLLLMKFYFNKKSAYKTIFNKKWKSVQNSSILVINKNKLGKSKVSIIEDGKSKKGDAKITDKGTSLQLSFEDQEYFYKIILLTPIKLELENLVTTAILKYELLGSNAYSQSDNKVEDQVSMPMGEIQKTNK